MKHQGRLPVRSLAAKDIDKGLVSRRKAQEHMTHHERLPSVVLYHDWEALQ